MSNGNIIFLCGMSLIMSILCICPAYKHNNVFILLTQIMIQLTYSSIIDFDNMVETVFSVSIMLGGMNEAN